MIIAVSEVFSKTGRGVSKGLALSCRQRCGTITLMAEDKNAPDAGASPAQPQPGTVISPGAAQPAQASRPVKPAQGPPEPVVLPPEPEAGEPAQMPEAPSPPPAQDIQATEDDGQGITWTASEFIAHHKSAGWYVGLMVGTVALAAVIFLLTKDKVSTGVAIIAGLMLGIYAAHQPRQLEYRVDGHGVSIGQSQHPYDEFRSFSVVPEGAFSSIVFMPLKRFALPTTLYYAPADEDRIVSILADQLPLENHQPDAVDRLMRRIRF